MLRHMFLFIGLCCLSSVAIAQVDLPTGSHPPALEFPHFPNRLHAVVWRNWNLVPTERIAKTLQASEEQINRVARSMGLEENQPIASRFEQQIYITIVRRNWHLLPYQQLLTLLDMQAEQLEVALREDDFLYIKLGSLKPKCEPVVYQEPDKEARAQAAWIKETIQRYRTALTETEIEPRFAFIDQLSKLPKDWRSIQERTFDPEAPPRYIYSYFGIFGDPLMDDQLDPYPEGLLARLAEQGVNGVWLHVVLWQLAPRDPTFPEFGKDSEIRRANLKRLVERAKKYGIAIYLYMNEPRSQPPEFFEGREEMRGVAERETCALCTSNPEVRRWMTDSLAHVFAEIPELGGVFTITASENLTNCASHFQHAQCPRCKDRTPAEIIGEVNACIEEGVHRGSPEAKVLTWDWGWNGHREAGDHIEKLPDNVWQLSVSEWSQPFSRGGVPSQIGEYSMSVVGPGPRAQLHWQLARQRGLKTAAKVQINNTWELSAVPFLPVMDLVAEHAENLADQDVDGLMLSWSLGGYPSPNLQIAQRLLNDPAVSSNQVLAAVARERYGEAVDTGIRAAWTDFSQAFREFPYSGATLYNGPQNYGPVNLLFDKPTGYSATMLGFPYDDLNGWRGHYPPSVFVEQASKLAEQWRSGTEKMEQLLPIVDNVHRETLQRDFYLAHAAGLHFESMANQSRFLLARSQPASEERTQTMNDCLTRERETAIKLDQLTRRDSRIGFEASNQYYYLPQDMMEKVLNCEHLLEQLNNE